MRLKVYELGMTPFSLLRGLPSQDKGAGLKIMGNWAREVILWRRPPRVQNRLQAMEIPPPALVRLKNPSKVLCPIKPIEG